MKILQINRYHHLRGGSDTVYFNTSKLLLSKGHEVRYFAMHYDENVKTSDEIYFTPVVEFLSLSFRKRLAHFFDFFYNKKASTNIEKLIIDFKPDIAHIHLFYGSLTSSILAKLKKFQVPIVITAHDYRLICPAYRFLNGKNRICEKCGGKKYFNCLTNKCAKNSYLMSLLFSLEAYFRDIFYPPQSYISKFIFVSKFSKSIHLKYKSLIRDKSVHIYNFHPKPKIANLEIKRGDYFLYLGRLSNEKGILTLLNAFDKRPNYRLKISGAGPLLDEVLFRATRNIIYCGFNEGEILNEIIKNCSYVIVPSEWYETFGMVIIEACSLGKPVIAADIGGISEIVIPNENGLLFRPFSIDELITAIDNAYNKSDSEYQDLSRKAARFAEGFQSDQHYAELMKVYQSVINK